MVEPGKRERSEGEEGTRSSKKQAIPYVSLMEYQPPAAAFNIRTFLESKDYTTWLNNLSVGDCVDTSNNRGYGNRRWYVSYITKIVKNPLSFEVSSHSNSNGNTWAVSPRSNTFAPLCSFSATKSDLPTRTLNPIHDRELQSCDFEMVNNIRKLVKDKQFADFEIVFSDKGQSLGGEEGIRYFGHRTILQSRCPGIFNYLSKIEDSERLEGSEGNSLPQMVLDSCISLRSFSYIWEFVYTGRISQGSHVILPDMAADFILTVVAFEAFRCLSLDSLLLTQQNIVEFIKITDLLLRVIENQESIKESDNTKLSLEDKVFNQLRNSDSKLVKPKIGQFLFSIHSACSKLFIDNAQGLLSMKLIQNQIHACPQEGLTNLMLLAIQGKEVKDVAKSTFQTYTAQHREEVYSVPDDPFFDQNPSLLHFIKDLKLLFKNRTSASNTTDLEIETHGRTYFAHRCILGVQSSFFAALVNSEMKDCQKVSLDKTFKLPDSFEVVLRFMYFGQINAMSFETAFDVLQCIAFFGLKSDVLRKACEYTLVLKATDDTIASVISLFSRIQTHWCLFDEVVQSASHTAMQKIQDPKVLHEAIETLKKGRDYLSSKKGVVDSQTCVFIYSNELSIAVYGRWGQASGLHASSIFPFCKKMTAPQLTRFAGTKEKTICSDMNVLLEVIPRHLTRFNIQ